MGLTTQAGIGPETLEGAGSGSGSLVALPVETYETGPIDMTKSFSNMEMVPAKVGHVAIPLTCIRNIVELVSGTQTVPSQINAGSDATHTNYLVSSALPSNADVNGASSPCVTSASGFNGLTVGALQPNTPVFLDMTAGAQGTGGFALIARFFIQVYWFNVEAA